MVGDGDSVYGFAQGFVDSNGRPDRTVGKDSMSVWVTEESFIAGDVGEDSFSGGFGKGERSSQQDYEEKR